MPVYAIDFFVENTTKMVLITPFNRKNKDQTKIATKLCIFLYNTMGTTGIRRGMGIIHLEVLDTFFHSGEA